MQEHERTSDRIRKNFLIRAEESSEEKEMDELEKEIKMLKNETSSYMKKRQKNELNIAGFTILFTAFARSSFDKDAFIAGESNGAELYRKYSKEIPMERVTVKVAK